MSWLRKLPGSRKEPHGLEWVILKKTPWALFYSLLVISIFVAVGYLMPPEGAAEAVNKHLEMVKILGIAVWITAWTAILTVAFGAFIVYLMKGPAYVADQLELIDSDEPKD